ncbi:MAG: band 7 protein [Anaerolineae bacterium]|nr:band 7 protein [Anaerolineae bacterium]
MAHISKLAFWRHLRAEPNQYILHYQRGQLARRGPGLAYWFQPLSAAVAQVPVEDIETTFILNEYSSDFQAIKVQITLTYRCSDPEKAANRVNFGLALESGAWIEQPLERLASTWSRWAQHPTRACLSAMPIVDVVRSGADKTRLALEEDLRSNAEIAAMGLDLVSIQVDQVVPSADLEKALQTPTREAIQQKADEATFQRRALAVEKERAIKENELATEIELTRRQEELIRRDGANKMLNIQQEAERGRFKVEAQVEQETVMAQGAAKQVRLRAEGEAQARSLMLDAEIEAETRRANLWKEIPPSVIFGLAVQGFADKIESIGHVHLTPDLLGETLQNLLLGKSDGA